MLIARFMYGPLDMVTLTGEKVAWCDFLSLDDNSCSVIWLQSLCIRQVDIHIMKDPPNGEWTYLNTEVTEKNGRLSFVIPDEMSLGYGMYPVKMVVR